MRHWTLLEISRALSFYPLKFDLHPLLPTGVEGGSFHRQSLTLNPTYSASTVVKDYVNGALPKAVATSRSHRVNGVLGIDSRFKTQISCEFQTQFRGPSALQKYRNMEWAKHWHENIMKKRSPFIVINGSDAEGQPLESRTPLALVEDRVVAAESVARPLDCSLIPQNNFRMPN
jgi:hypothetical protein